MDHKRTVTGLILAVTLLGASVVNAQPATASRDALLSTEDWTAADTNDDDTLSAAELNRAEPSLAAYFREIDANGDRRIARDELAAWQAGPDPGSTDADELPAGEVDEGDLTPESADRASDGDADETTSRTDDLLPDDGDQSSELLPDDGDDAGGLRRDDEREDDDRRDAVER